MESTPDMFPEGGVALKEKVRCLTAEIQTLRERESHWMDERKVLLQRERLFAEQWQERERLWQDAFHARDRQWAQAQMENFRRWDEWKSLHDQRQKEFETSAKESEEREELLLKVLKDEKEHLIIEIENDLNTFTRGGENTQPSGEERTLQVETAQFWQWVYHTSTQQWSQALSDNHRRWVEWKALNDQQIQELEKATKDSEEREKLLLKLLKEEKQPLVIEIENIIPETKETHVSGKERIRQSQETEQFWQSQLETQRRWDEWKSLYDQRLQEFENTAKQYEVREELLLKMLKEDKRHLIIEIEKPLNTLIPEAEKTQPSGEDRTRQIQEKELFWQSVFHTSEQQWSQALSDNQRRWVEWKSLNDQQIQELENAAKESDEREKLLLKLLKEETRHLVIEIEKTIPSEEEKPQQSHYERGRPLPSVKPVYNNNNALVTSGGFPGDLEYSEKPPAELHYTISDANVAKMDPCGDSSPTSAEKATESQKADPYEQETVTENHGVLNMEDLSTQITPETPAKAVTEVLDSKEASLGKEAEASSPVPKETEAEAPLNNTVKQSQSAFPNLQSSDTTDYCKTKEKTKGKESSEFSAYYGDDTKARTEEVQRNQKDLIEDKPVKGEVSVNEIQTSNLCPTALKEKTTEDDIDLSAPNNSTNPKPSKGEDVGTYSESVDVPIVPQETEYTVNDTTPREAALGDVVPYLKERRTDQLPPKSTNVNGKKNKKGRNKQRDAQVVNVELKECQIDLPTGPRSKNLGHSEDNSSIEEVITHSQETSAAKETNTTAEKQKNKQAQKSKGDRKWRQDDYDSEDDHFSEYKATGRTMRRNRDYKVGSKSLLW